MKHASEKYCYECAAVLPRVATLCGSCLAAQPPLPQKDPSAPSAAPAAPAASAEAGRRWDSSDMLLAVGAAMLLVMGVHASREPVPPPPAPAASASAAAPPASEPTEAWAEARRLVAQHLRAPPTVAWSSEHHSTRIAPNTYEVSSWLEAANTHGTVVRTRWTAVVARRHDGWRLERLEARN